MILIISQLNLSVQTTEHILKGVIQIKFDRYNTNRLILKLIHEI